MFVVTPDIIKKIKKLVDDNIEHGGWINYGSLKHFRGDMFSITVPYDEPYKIHWHTHPGYLINNGNIDSTGPVQPPSQDDLAQTSYKFFSTDFPFGRIMVHIVFTQYGIYIQTPIPSTLESFFKTKNFKIIDKKTKETWTNKWYNRFLEESSPILKKIRSLGYDLTETIHPDTDEIIKLNKKEYTEYYKKSLLLESLYFTIAKKYGIKVEKINSWSEVLKTGFSVDIDIV